MDLHGEEEIKGKVCMLPIDRSTRWKAFEVWQMVEEPPIRMLDRQRKTGANGQASEMLAVIERRVFLQLTFVRPIGKPTSKIKK